MDGRSPTPWREVSAPTLQRLRRGGWSEGRRVDTTEWERQLREAGYEVSCAAREPLAEFGGLQFNPDWPWSLHFVPEAVLRSLWPSWLRTWERKVGKPLCPIGESFAASHILAVDPGGMVWEQSSTADKAHLVLDVVGTVPVSAEPADLLNALISAGRGRYGEALLSVGAAIPLVGNLGTGAKLPGKTANLGAGEAAFVTSRLARLLSDETGSAGSRASVSQLIAMMNKRLGVTARFATGDAEACLRYQGAQDSPMLFPGGESDMLLRKDVATRAAAFHERLHRRLQLRNGGPTPGEEGLIERFLARHERLFGIDG